ncbi:MAG: gamma carbonic anhydrase family protein [Nocardioides sp.]|uniref:gamma carbonic anhydrase family protein n=1 Tax=Nocardioides sp. TaxID=35761 RepID=UPI003F086AF0
MSEESDVQGNIFEFEGVAPTVHPDAWVAPTATLIGDVTVEAGASIWYGAVLRGDVAGLRVGARANVQDNTVVHVGMGEPLTIGADVTVGHACVVHCQSIGDGSLIGNGAVLLDGVTIGARSVVAAGAVVTSGTHVPDGVLAAGTPAKVLKETAGSSAELWLEHNAEFYHQLAGRHAGSLRRITD